MTFDDILIIKNGKNQRAVENPDGKYPIYGSGGIMGYADDYICEADTVIVGRKGSINNPIFVEEPFWNVDTAFGLVAKREVLLPRYLYYFCRNYDFERLNKAVTIPSLTKSDLLKIEITLPSLEIQEKIVNKLLKIEEVIQARQQQLQKLDQLVKARFVELFGDRWANNLEWPQKPLKDCATFYNGKAHEQVVDEHGEYILVTSKCIASDQREYRRTNTLLFPLQCGDICMVMSDVPNGRALAKCMMITEDNRYTLNQRICCLRGYSLHTVFFMHVLNRHEYLLSFNDGDSQTNLRKDDLLACPIILPPMDLQEQFAAFVEQVDESKVAVQKALDEAQLLFDSLMQKYFQ